MSTVEVRTVDGVGVLTLNRPQTRNAITVEMSGDIDRALDVIEADESVNAVVVTGAGEAFCAGADLDLVAKGDPAIFRSLYAAFLRVASCPLPTVAAVNGAATGAGLNLLLCCDIVLTVPRARFVARFLDLGLHPGGGSTWMLSRAVGAQQAKAMMLCNEELDGEGAVTAGLALRCFAPDQLLPEAIALAVRAASAPRPVLIRAKATMAATGVIDNLDEAVEIEAAAQAWSATLPYFAERVARLKKALAAKRGRVG
jgi:enoyl-CoA hydratase